VSINDGDAAEECESSSCGVIGSKRKKKKVVCIVS